MNLIQDSNDERFGPAGGGLWRDLLTGRLIPVIAGSDDSEDGDGDGVEDDDDDDDDETAELNRLQAEFTKQNRAGGKKALRSLAKKYGFESRADLEAFLAANVDTSDDDDSSDDGSSSADDEKPVSRKRADSVVNSSDRRREIRLDIREALADAAVQRDKAELAVAAIVGQLDMSDPDLDGDDVAEAVEKMMKVEPSWFDGNDGDSGNAGVVPGASSSRRKKQIRKSSDEIAAEEYERFKSRSRPSKRLAESTR